MSMGMRDLLNAVESGASASGWFDSVNGHEPKSAPGGGLTFACWVSRVSPSRSSGLASTSVRVEITARIYMPFRNEPEDGIDPTMADAIDALMTAYSGGFTLGGFARAVDLLGSDGTPLSVSTGYQNIGNSIFRVADIIVPILVNDAWTQGA